MASTRSLQGTTDPRATRNRRATSTGQIKSAVNGIPAPATTPAAAASRGRAAGRTAVKRNSTDIHIPLIGNLTLPPPENVVWFGAMAALVAFEILEWPVALVLGLGKVLSDNRHNKVIQDLGAALAEAG